MGVGGGGGGKIYRRVFVMEVEFLHIHWCQQEIQFKF